MSMNRVSKSFPELEQSSPTRGAASGNGAQKLRPTPSVDKRGGNRSVSVSENTVSSGSSDEFSCSRSSDNLQLVEALVQEQFIRNKFDGGKCGCTTFFAPEFERAEKEMSGPCENKREKQEITGTRVKGSRDRKRDVTSLLSIAVAEQFVRSEKLDWSYKGDS